MTGISRKTFARALVAALLFAWSAAFCASAHAMTAKEFHKQALKMKGINAFASTCQSAHETGDWTSVLWKKARNGAGIKADKAWIRASKPYYKRTSNEHVGGRVVKRTSNFRKYKSLHSFLTDYAAKIRRDYPASSKNSDTFLGYFAMLRKGRYGAWATDPRYFDKLLDKAMKFGPVLLGSSWKVKFAADFKRATQRKLLSAAEIASVKKRFAAAGIKL